MAEIKIRELSVGDWVRYRDADANVRVSSIYSDGYVFIVGEEDSGISESVNAHHHIEPIPLTPEILEKNGISKTYESDEYAVYKGEGFNVTEYYTELWEFEKHRNRLMIRNVHQLQHALRLAGVEKEIEL